jgi:hypothetical protein
VRIGLCELALGALSGWWIVVRLERPELLARLGIRSPRRLMQCHLDLVMMGLILVAVGLALPDLSRWIAAPIAFATILNPLLFLPLAVDEDMQGRLPYRVITVVSFVALSGGLVAAAVTGLTA